jgi:hypothetical protein
MASIYDITKNAPRSGLIMVDTSAWFLGMFIPSLPSEVEQDLPHWEKRKSQAYAKALASLGKRKVLTGLQLSELAVAIEKFNYRAYLKYQELTQEELPLKEYRAIEEEREYVIEDITTSWKDLIENATFKDVTFADGFSQFALDAIVSFKLDGHDAYALAAMNDLRITEIITDDADFCAVDSLHVFTYNKKVLQHNCSDLKADH